MHSKWYVDHYVIIGLFRIPSWSAYFFRLATSEENACRKGDGDNFLAQVFFFVAQLVAGVGQSLKHTLGLSYLDDNIQKSKTPALISISYFMRLLGPGELKLTSVRACWRFPVIRY